jgi:hypothetical protein
MRGHAGHELHNQQQGDPHNQHSREEGSQSLLEGRGGVLVGELD